MPFVGNGSLGLVLRGIVFQKDVSEFWPSEYMGIALFPPNHQSSLAIASLFEFGPLYIPSALRFSIESTGFSS